MNKTLAQKRPDSYNFSIFRIISETYVVLSKITAELKAGKNMPNIKLGPNQRLTFDSSMSINI